MGSARDRHQRHLSGVTKVGRSTVSASSTTTTAPRPPSATFLLRRALLQEHHRRRQRGDDLHAAGIAAQTTVTVTLPVAGKVADRERGLDRRSADRRIDPHRAHERFGPRPASSSPTSGGPTTATTCSSRSPAPASGSTSSDCDLQGKRVVVRGDGGMLSGLRPTATETASTSPASVPAPRSPRRRTISGTLAAAGRRRLTAYDGTPVGGAAIDYDGSSWRVDGREVTHNKSGETSRPTWSASRSASAAHHVRTTVSNSDTSYVATAGPIMAGTDLPGPDDQRHRQGPGRPSLLLRARGVRAHRLTLLNPVEVLGVAITGATASTYALTAADAVRRSP